MQKHPHKKKTLEKKHWEGENPETVKCGLSRLTGQEKLTDQVWRWGKREEVSENQEKEWNGMNPSPMQHLVADSTYYPYIYLMVGI